MDLREERRMAEADFFISLSHVEQKGLEVDAYKAIKRVFHASNA